MPRILIIDDDDAVRASTKIMLEAGGFSVACAADGPAGIRAVEDEIVDLVICDLFLPKMNGLEASKAVRKIKPHMPIIIASGFMFGGGECPAMPNFEAMTVEASATVALYKPLKPKDLLQAIQKLLPVAA